MTARRVRLTGAARRDLSRLPEFLALESPRAAQGVRKVLIEALKSLESLPERGRPASDPQFRELPVPFGRDGYVVQYRVDPDVVVIARIFHTREQR